MLPIVLAVLAAAQGATAVVVAARIAGKETASGLGTTTTMPADGPAPAPTVSPPPPVVAPSTTSSTVGPSTTSPTRPPQPCARLQALSTRGKLAQLLFVGVSDAATARTTLSGPNPAGGVLVLGRGSTWFADGVLKGIAADSAVPPVVAADEEGGRVQRIDAVHGRIPSAAEMGRLPLAEVTDIAKRRGGQLRDLGFTMDFAPVVDVYDRSNAVINDRAFAADPDKVVAYGGAFASGLQQAGIAPVLKHFPGHGRSTGDSHKQAVAVPSLAELRTNDLIPFTSLARSVPAVMVGHLDVPGLTDPGRPTSVSPAAIDGLLRKEIGFRGLVITDDLSSMKAITDRFTVPEAVVASIVAGADVAIIALSAGQTMAPMLTALERAVSSGTLPMARVDDALAHLGATKPGCR